MCSMVYAHIHSVVTPCTPCVGVKVCAISTKTTTIKG